METKFEWSDNVLIEVTHIKRKAFYANEAILVKAKVVSSDYGSLEVDTQLEFQMLRKYIMAPEEMLPGKYRVDVQKRASTTYLDAHGNERNYASPYVFKRLICEDWYNLPLAKATALMQRVCDALIDNSVKHEPENKYIRSRGRIL